MARPFPEKTVSAARALWPDLPTGTDIAMTLVDNEGHPFAVFWAQKDPDDPMVAQLHTHVCVQDACSDEDLTGKERYSANVLVARRHLDVVHLVRQGDTIDFRAKGAEFDAKLAEVLKRNQTRP